MRRFDDKAQAYLSYAVLFIGMFLLFCWMMGFFDSDAVELYESGTLNSVTSQSEKFKLSIDVDDVEYKKSFNHLYKLEDYQDWLVQWTGYDVDFYYYEGGSFYDLYVHDVKNATVKKVMYTDDGFWWWEKPPMKVIFSDGSNFVFTGSSEYKFNMYSRFIAFDGEYVNIHYSFDMYDDVRIHNIFRIMEA